MGIYNNYVSGYVSLGLLFATDSNYNFNIDIPSELTSLLNNWLTYIQNNNGGSGYSSADEDIDILKTGNLLVEMKFLNYSNTNIRVTSASNYIANTWYEPACFKCSGWNSIPVANYQSIYALMSGLICYNYSVINQTVYPFNQIDYFIDIANVILSQQNSNGSFNPNPYDFSQSDKMLSSIWALLSLQLVPLNSEYINIKLSSDKINVKQNDIVTYTNTISNMGSVDVYNAILKDNLPDTLNFIEGSVIINGENQPFEVSPITGISLSNIHVSDVNIISYECKVLASTLPAIDNIASITFDYIPPFSTAHNIKTSYSHVVSLKYLLASLNISAKLNKMVALVGEILIYTLSVLNNGDYELDDIVITTNLGPNLQYLNNLTINGITSYEDVTTGVNIGNLAVNSISIIEFEVQIQVVVINPEIFISKDIDKSLVQKNEIVNYSITIENAGELDSFNTVLTETLPYQLEFLGIMLDGIPLVGNLSTGINLGTLPKHTTKLVDISVKPIGNICNFTNLVLIQSTSLTTVVVGEIVRFNLKVQNTGNMNLSNIVISNLLSSNFNYIPSSLYINGVHEKNESIINGIKLDTLFENQVVIIQFDARLVSDSPNSILNQSYATYNYAISGNIYKDDSFSNSILLSVVSPNVSIIKTASSVRICSSDIADYIVSITNTGNTTISSVVFKDKLTQTVNLVTSSFNINNKMYNINRCNLEKGINLGNILPGQTTVVKFKVKIIKCNCLPYGSNQIDNTAYIQYIYTVPNENRTIHFTQKSSCSIYIYLTSLYKNTNIIEIRCWYFCNVYLTINTNIFYSYYICIAKIIFIFNIKYSIYSRCALYRV